MNNTRPDSSQVVFKPAGTGAVSTTVQSKLRERVSVSDFGAVGDGVTNDYAAIQAAHDSLSADGGEIYFPSGLYSIATKLRITKRNVRFIGENSYNTYILPTAAVVDAPIHVMGFTFELANFTVYSPAGVGGYCVWSRGAGDLYVHDNVFLNGGPINTGYAVVLEDVNEVSTFVPGAYRHRFHRNTIGPYNNYFSYGIITGFGCTGGGMNACVFSENQMICYNGFSIAKGGGNTYFGNLLQSATGGNSGGRPFTGGAGYGFIFGGESHFVGNYCERFLVDFYQSSSSATYSVTGHTSDASNEVYVGQSGWPSPAEVVTGYGVSAEKLDIQPTVTITANGTTLRTDRRAITLLGNAGQYTGLILSAVGAKEGQLITVYNNSYAMQFANGGAIDLTGWGSQLVLGQQGLSLLGVTTQGNWADFIFTASNTWKLLNVGTHGNLVGGTSMYSFFGNGETLPTFDAYIDITGAGAARSGALLTAGTTYGQSLTLTANSWSVAFAAGAAVWSASGAPTMGNGVGQVQAMQLVYTTSGWTEVSRSTRP